MYFIPKEIGKQVKKEVKNYRRLWQDICKLCEINREILWLNKKGLFRPRYTRNFKTIGIEKVKQKAYY